MATSTSIATSALTPSQEAAREFWRQAGADGMPPFYVMSQYYAQLSASSDNLLAVTAALNQLLTGLGYETDVDTVFTEFDPGQKEELGYWTGHYCLVDNDANRFDLVVGRNGATLTVPPALVDVTKLPAGADLASVTVLSDANFSDGVLQLKNAQFQASLFFASPVKDEDFDEPSHPAAAMFQSTAPRCNGTFAAVGGGAAAARPVNGKRGAWTPAGVAQTADGDPVSAWYGQYVLLDVTEVMAAMQAGGADAGTASVVQVPDPVYIYNDPSGLTFQWGARYGSNVTYNNNVLQCAEEGDENTQYAMQFTAPQAGAAELNLAVTKGGVVRSYKGYWVGRYPPPRPASRGRLAKRPMTAPYSAGSDASAGGYSQAIDVSTLTPDGKTTIVLPLGAVGNKYALSLDLTNCAATDTFSWALSNDPTGRAAIAPSGDTNQTAQFTLNDLSDSDQFQVTVQLTKTSVAPPVTYTLLLVIAVIRCDAITIEPAVLPPVVVGTAYTQKLAAYGAQGHFTWSVISSSLPPGLTWDATSQQLSGTVTDAAQVGKAFSLVLKVAASDMIMDPLTALLGITVQSAPAVASDIPLWEKILLYGQGGFVALLTIAVFAAYRIKTGRAKAKVADAARAGNTIIESATGRDPRSVSRSIVQADRQRFPSLEGNIQVSQSTIESIILTQDGISDALNRPLRFIYLAEEYLSDHRSDDPNTEVEDATLRNMGIDTIGKLEFSLRLEEVRAQSYRDALATTTEWLNSARANTQSNRNKTNEITITKLNDDSLLI